MEQELIAGLLEARGDGDAIGLLESKLGAIDQTSMRLLKGEIDVLKRADPQAALKIADIMLMACRSTADLVCSGLSLWAKANVLRELGEYDDALSHYGQAESVLARADDPMDVASTLIGKIDALMYLSKYGEASAAARKARQLFLEQGEVLLAAKVDANMGNLYHRTDHYRAALQRYGRARRTFFQLGEKVLVAQVDVNRANVLTLVDRFSTALGAYRRARAVFDQSGAKAVVAMIDANMGFLFHQMGRLNRALELYTAAATTFLDLGIVKNAATVDLDLAQVHLDLNMPSECLALCESALAVFERLGMRAEKAQALAVMALGRARLGQSQEALQLLEESGALCHLEENEVRAASADLSRAVLLVKSRPNSTALDQALKLAKQSAEVFRKHGIAGKIGVTSLVEGQVHALRGETHRAVLSYDYALGLATRFGLPWLTHQVLHAKGRLLSTVNADQAVQCLEEAIGVLEGMREELRSEGARNLFLGDKLQAYRDLVLLLLDKGDDGVRRAFQYVERAKSRALVDLLRGELEVRVRGEADQGLVRRIQALREELNWFYNRLDEGDGKGQRLSSQRLEHIAAEVRVRERQLAQCMDRLQLASPEYSGLYGRSLPCLEEVQSALDGDEALVEYYDAGQEILCFVVTRSSLHVQRGVANPEVVAALARRLSFQFGKFNYGDRYIADHFDQLLAATNDCLSHLYDELLRPIEGRIEGMKLVFVPHGGLHALPFHAFRDGDQYVIQHHDVSYSPSAGVLRFVVDRKPADFRSCLLVGVSDERAPAVEEEIESIRHLLPKHRCVTGKAATMSALRANSGSWDIVHIASHALFSSGNPMFSRLRLADGWLNVYDIYNLRLNASLVTLSSCQTGVSKIVGSDEIIGISRGFLYAGAASLLASLWAVNDLSTANLMRTFYQNLVHGASKRSALRSAQIQMEAEYGHPYYWAPFVLVGRSN
ncbi:MAG: CHAT domain-containing protein [Chloroflexi bacterium]|nr:CHAT domain-containing protein [Chloroflexota bacterium]